MSGVFVLDISGVILGVLLMIVYAQLVPTPSGVRSSTTRVPHDIGTPIGLFGIEPA
jgi:hypothetical protein